MRHFLKLVMLTWTLNLGIFLAASLPPEALENPRSLKEKIGAKVHLIYPHRGAHDELWSGIGVLLGPIVILGVAMRGIHANRKLSEKLRKGAAEYARAEGIIAGMEETDGDINIILANANGKSLEERLAALTKNAAKTEAILTGAEGEMPARAQSVGQQIAVVRATLNEFSARAKTLCADSNALDGQVEELEGERKKINTDLDRIGGEKDPVRKLKKTVTAIDELEQRFAAVERAAPDVAPAKQKLMGMLKMLTNLEGRDIVEEVLSLGRLADTISEKLDSLEDVQDGESLREKLDEANRELNAASRRIAEITNGLTAAT